MDFMKRKTFLLMALALLCSVSFVSCGDGENVDEPIVDPVTPKLEGTYTGWILGSNQYAPYIPSEGDQLTIKLLGSDAHGQATCRLTLVSETWGTATFDAVGVTKTATGYVFSKPVTATLREDHSAWDFSAAVDSIAMPNRNPQSGTVTVSNYPIVLTNGTMSLECDKWQFDFTAYLVPRTGHVMTMSFRNGSIQPPTE